MYNSKVKYHPDEELIDSIRDVAWVITMEKNLSVEDLHVLANVLSNASLQLKLKAIDLKEKAA